MSVGQYGWLLVGAKRGNDSRGCDLEGVGKVVLNNERKGGRDIEPSLALNNGEYSGDGTREEFFMLHVDSSGCHRLLQPLPTASTPRHPVTLTAETPTYTARPSQTVYCRRHER